MANGDEQFILQAIEVARASSSEDTLPRPKVGAALVRNGKLEATAYRGELKPGEHAEYTLLQHKLQGEDLRGTTMFTTLEPCTTRNHPKRPCADWIVERGIHRVVVGILDPNPRVYERGVERLREAGVLVDFFPAHLRETVMAENRPFIERFRASPNFQGTVSFNFRHNDGLYSLGHGELLFQTRWSNASNTSIHIYTDRTGLRGLGVVRSARSFRDIRDASVYDMSSRVQTPREGQYVVLQNAFGHYAAIRVDNVMASSHGDAYDEVTITYRINPDGSPMYND